MKKFYISIAIAMCAGLAMNAQTRVYFNDFESNSKRTEVTIQGTGSFVDATDAHYGKVYHNVGTGNTEAIRANYLLLPSTALASSDIATNKELSIAFWVDKGTCSGAYWNPIFSAYSAAPTSSGNTWPMMAIQYRMVGQVNCNGWTDLTWANNVNYSSSSTENPFNTTWLDDANWHYFTATYTETKVTFYIDGVVQNAWNCDGTDGKNVSGLFSSAGSLLTYICLGGNQAWSWGDVDPAFMYDDVAIYANALTVDQINALKTAKTTTTAVENNQAEELGEVVKVEYFTLTGKPVANENGLLETGLYIKQTTYQSGVVKCSKIGVKR